MVDGRCYIPGRLNMQWHVTDHCNLSCRHCYQGRRGDEPDFSGLMRVLDGFCDLLREWRTAGRGVRGHITVTGGEPFVRDDFMRLLEVFHQRREVFDFSILTNGTLLDEDRVGELARFGPAYVQVSIDGSRAVHDRIRGAGSFGRAVRGIRLLVKNHIPVLISFTAHNGNYQDFPAVAVLGRKLGVKRVWTDRFVPEGHGKAMADLVMGPVETREFFEIVKREQDKARHSWLGKTEISMGRALQFLVGGGRPYHCTAGDRLITVMPGGDVYPCRRMPIKVWNVFETRLGEIYEQSDLFQQLRDRERVSEGCGGCFYGGVCRGGLKCLAWAMSGDLFMKDPGCWLGEKNV